MSFILDALRRAEAERARGTVPGLHTPMDDLLPVSDRRRMRWPGWASWATVAAALLATALLAGWWGRSSGPVPALVPPASVATVAPPQATVALPGSEPRGAGPAPREVLVERVLPPGASALPAVPPEPARGTTRARAADRGAAPAGQRDGQTPEPAAPTQPPSVRTPLPAGQVRPESKNAPADGAPVSPPGQGVSPVPWLAEMPAAFRGQLPGLAVSGGMYSDQPEQRLVIVNGLVLREGDSVSAGLVLEQVRARSAVFSWQGQRFALPM